MEISGKLQALIEEIEAQVQQEQAKTSRVYSLLGFEAAGQASALFEPLLESFCYVTRAMGASVTTLDAEKGCLVFRYAVGIGSENIIGMDVPLKGSQLGLAFATGEAQATRPLHRGVADSTGDVHDSVLVAPLILAEESIGTISAVNKEGGGGFQPEDMEAAERFAAVAAQLVRFQTGLSDVKSLVAAEDSPSGARERKIFRLAEGIARLAEKDETWLDDFLILLERIENRSR